MLNGSWGGGGVENLYWDRDQWQPFIAFNQLGLVAGNGVGLGQW